MTVSECIREMEELDQDAEVILMEENAWREFKSSKIAKDELLDLHPSVVIIHPAPPFNWLKKT